MGATERWEHMANSPQDGFPGLWPAPWPDVGGGGASDMRLSQDELFRRMITWQDANYIMACGTAPGSDTHDVGGWVDSRAYTILTCIRAAGGSDFDLICIRNLWRTDEIQSSLWCIGGMGWDQFPDVKAACRFDGLDTSISWLDKEEFFHIFKSVYLCAFDMAFFCSVY